MDRVFLDANILFSAAYGSPRITLLWERARGGHCRLLASSYVMEEARRNLSTPDQVERLDQLVRAVELVPEPPRTCLAPCPCPRKTSLSLWPQRPQVPPMSSRAT